MSWTKSWGAVSGSVICHDQNLPLEGHILQILAKGTISLAFLSLAYGQTINGSPSKCPSKCILNLLNSPDLSYAATIYTRPHNSLLLACGSIILFSLP